MDINYIARQALRGLLLLLLVPFYPLVWLGRGADGEPMLDEHIVYLLVWIFGLWVALVSAGILHV